METSEQRAKRLAAALINTPRAPAGYAAVMRLAAEASAYDALNPYPWWHFHEWKPEERGPYPRAMPFIRSIIRRGARWVWGKTPQIDVGPPAERGDDGKRRPKPAADLEKYLREAWVRNRMPSRMLSASAQAGVRGGFALKFSYDETAPVPLRFSVLGLGETRLYHDPHDADRLLMARIQYPYQDPADGKWYLHREEWTEAEWVTYQPVIAHWQPTQLYTPGGMLNGPMVATVQDGNTDPDAYHGWIPTRARNPFGVIPLQPVKNLDCDGAWGIGDLWGLFRVVDRVNLTYHLMDRSNQHDADPTMILIDVDTETLDLERPLAPGQPLSAKSDETDTGEAKHGQVVMAEARGSLRPAMQEYAKDLRRQIVEAASSVEVDPESFTNKGNMTQSVLAQLYGPLVEITREKRQCQGEDGAGKFLETVIRGMANLGRGPREFRGVQVDDPESYSVELCWPDLLPTSEDEKTAKVTRLKSEAEAGWMPPERAAGMVAHIEGVEDVEAFEDEIQALLAAKAEEAAEPIEPAEPTAPPPAEPGE